MLHVAQFHTTLPSQFPQPHETLWIARHCIIKLLNNWSSCLLFLSIKFIMISSCIRNNESDCVDLPFKGCFRAVVGSLTLVFITRIMHGQGLDAYWTAPGLLFLRPSLFDIFNVLKDLDHFDDMQVSVGLLLSLWSGGSACFTLH